MAAGVNRKGTMRAKDIRAKSTATSQREVGKALTRAVHAAADTVGADASSSRHRPALSQTRLVEPDRVANALVVDDECAVAYFVQRALAERGYTCDCAASGAQALAMVSEHQYDVVVCDVCLGDMDGLEVLRHIRRESADTAVVMLSG